jgi:hypothetical protein
MEFTAIRSFRKKIGRRTWSAINPDTLVAGFARHFSGSNRRSEAMAKVSMPNGDGDVRAFAGKWRACAEAPAPGGGFPPFARSGSAAGGAIWRWLTGWADAFGEARAYARLRRQLEDYDDHLLVDVGLKRVGGRIEMLGGGAYAAAEGACREAGTCRRR